MIFVDNENVTDPRLNLAVEEHLLRDRPTGEDLLFFFINEPSIIIGRYQNAWEEINPSYVDRHGIQVVRRLSGGGAVYHDQGNLCFSLITRGGKEDALNFKKFTAPVIRTLRGMGVPADLEGKSDIRVNGLKISGNAIYSTRQGIVCHGTLLFDTDLTVMSEALKVKPGEIESRSIKSVRSQVANIREFMHEPMEIEAFRQKLLHGIFDGSEQIPRYRLSATDWEAIEKYSKDRYMTWEWNYGKSPAFKLEKTLRFASGEVHALVQVQDGLIQSVNFQGDLAGQRDISSLERRLSGVRYTRKDLEEALQGIDVAAYFSGLTNTGFLEFFN